MSCDLLHWLAVKESSKIHLLTMGLSSPEAAAAKLACSHMFSLLMEAPKSCSNRLLLHLLQSGSLLEARIVFLTPLEVFVSL